MQDGETSTQIDRDKRDHQSYQQICTELHYTSGERRERQGTGGRGGWGQTIKRGQVTGKFTSGR